MSETGVALGLEAVAVDVDGAVTEATDVGGFSAFFPASVGTEPKIGGPSLRARVGGFAGDEERIAAAFDLAGRSANEPNAM